MKAIIATTLVWTVFAQACGPSDDDDSAAVSDDDDATEATGDDDDATGDDDDDDATGDDDDATGDDDDATGDDDDATPLPDADGDGQPDDLDCDDADPSVHGVGLVEVVQLDPYTLYDWEVHIYRPSDGATLLSPDDLWDGQLTASAASGTYRVSASCYAWDPCSDTPSIEVHVDGVQVLAPADFDVSFPDVVVFGVNDPDLDGSGLCDDCSPNDPARGTFNDEVCDGIDNDCDGAVPADETDGDGDGFLSCADCDDADATAFPGAPELCDGDVEDCDGAAPDDSDGDGSTACDDCDDTEPTVLPGAPELCDGLDNDCDPSTIATAFGDDVDLDADGIADCIGASSSLLDRALSVAFDHRQDSELADLLQAALLADSDGSCPAESTSAGPRTPNNNPTTLTEWQGPCTNAAGDWAGLLQHTEYSSWLFGEILASLSATAFVSPDLSFDGLLQHNWTGWDNSGGGMMDSYDDDTTIRQGTVTSAVGISEGYAADTVTTFDLSLSADDTCFGFDASMSYDCSGSGSLTGTASQVADAGTWSLTSSLSGSWSSGWSEWSGPTGSGCSSEWRSGSLVVVAEPVEEVAPFNAVVTFDGACDGCGTVTVDGVEFGAYCL